MQGVYEPLRRSGSARDWHSGPCPGRSCEYTEYERQWPLRLLYFTVACGFMRVYLKPHFLLHTSATSLAISDLAVQLGAHQLQLTIRTIRGPDAAGFSDL